MYICTYINPGIWSRYMSGDCNCYVFSSCKCLTKKGKKNIFVFCIKSSFTIITFFFAWKGRTRSFSWCRMTVPFHMLFIWKLLYQFVHQWDLLDIYLYIKRHLMLKRLLLKSTWMIDFESSIISDILWEQFSNLLVWGILVDLFEVFLL